LASAHASLSYLGRLPLDRLKLVRRLQPRSAYLQKGRVIAGVVEFAGAHGLPVTAES